MRNVEICRKCWKERQNETTSFSFAGTVSGFDLEQFTFELEEEYDSEWVFQYCHLEQPYDKSKPPPQDCPYILEHTISQRSV